MGWTRNNSKNNFNSRYGITRQRIQHWKKRIKLGKPLLDSSGGVTAISEIESEKVARKVIQLRAEKKPPGSAAMRAILFDARKNTTKKRGGARNVIAGVQHLSDSAFEKYVDEEYKERTAQPLTDARESALIDPITTITFALMLVAFAGFLPASNKINFDGTTIEVPDQSKGWKVFIHKQDPVEGPVASSEVQSALGRCSNKTNAYSVSLRTQGQACWSNSSKRNARRRILRRRSQRFKQHNRS